MTIRTRYSTVVFRKPFVLAGFDEELAAGTYRMETDEELLDTVSFPSWRRVRTVIHLHPDIARPGRSRSLTIDPLELDAAVSRDCRRLEYPMDVLIRHEPEVHTGDAGSSK